MLSGIEPPFSPSPRVVNRISADGTIRLHADRKVCEFIREEICYVSVITSQLRRSINLVDFYRQTDLLRVHAKRNRRKKKGEKAGESRSFIERESAEISSRRVVALGKKNLLSLAKLFS